MSNVRIIGINVSNRSEVAEKVQKVLTNYGCSIRTRLGLNEADEIHYGSGGLIILELTGDEKEWELMMKYLSEIDEIQVKFMDFERNI
ncbi:MAG: hypothetical protein CVT94_03825 [Bacteroidetes bacterium HGW-Bacteroidetes-11]|jgi:hypothetical protein|nr:MAG: hypothetical protein CVT94_03825 [Bacteroidetes bacterium HGW-Bacteroidetes-11]